MSATPSIPLFGDAYLADTRHLTLEEHGAYLQMLMIAWRSPACALPDDDARIAKMLGITPKKWARLRPAVMAFWTLCDAGWEQKRLSKERRFVAKKSEQNRDAANAKWKAKPLKTNGASDANAMPERCGNDAPPPSPTEEEKKEERKEEEAAPARVSSNGYAFEGRTIRLNFSDLRMWKDSYSAIPDLMAELRSLDDWFEGQPPEKRKKWYHVVSGSLNRRHQELLAAAAANEDDGEVLLLGPC